MHTPVTLNWASINVERESQATLTERFCIAPPYNTGTECRAVTN